MVGWFGLNAGKFRLDCGVLCCPFVIKIEGNWVVRCYAWGFRRFVWWFICVCFGACFV